MGEFSRGIRRWWMRVVEYSDGYSRDQTWVYSEEGGFRQSVLRADEVHHLTPSEYSLALGENPNNSVGLPVARVHHNKGGTTLPFCHSSSYHPDIEEARRKYRLGDKNAFEKAKLRHRNKAERGKRYWGGDWGSDLFYEEVMTQKALAYVQETGDKRPISNKNIRRRHWTDIYFGTRSYPEDEG